MTLSAHRIVTLAAVPGLRVPAGGWHHVQFKANAAALAKTTHRVATIARRTVGARIQKTVARHIRETVRRVAEQVGQGKSAGYRTKATTTVTFSLSSLWEAALEDVTAQVNKELARKLLPDIQSIIGQGYSRTAMLLGGAGDGDPKEHLKAARVMADAAESMNQTTVDDVKRFVARGYGEGLSDADIASEVEAALQRRALARADTAARTITQQGWDKGSGEAMVDNGVKTFSVIGCTSREVDQWDKPGYQEFMFDEDGRDPESTCNIQDVPMEYWDELVFHPNHTGTRVANSFDE
jgi:hypothetical protein